MVRFIFLGITLIFILNFFRLTMINFKCGVFLPLMGEWGFLQSVIDCFMC